MSLGLPRSSGAIVSPLKDGAMRAKQAHESPKDKCVRNAGQRALLDYFALQQHFPYEVAQAASHWLNVKFRIFPGAQNGSPDLAKSQPKPVYGGGQQRDEENHFRPRELNHKQRV